MLKTVKENQFQVQVSLPTTNLREIQFGIYQQ